MRYLTDPVLPAEEFAYELRTMLLPILGIVAGVVLISVVICIILVRTKKRKNR